MRSQKGITLVALIITVIVMVILAGVAINLALGNQGLIQTVQNATNEWTDAEENTQLRLDDVENQLNTILNTVQQNISDQS